SNTKQSWNQPYQSRPKNQKENCQPNRQQSHQHPQRYRKPPIAPEPPTTEAINIHHATEDQLNRLTKG
ncbi:hypothetical protein V3M41_05665, partial [Trueperella pyogenes]|uniref:hypothetical protein n=1 Tax=Trueperella pyogenes TaxID=1661 RepID=UPI00345CA44D